MTEDEAAAAIAVQFPALAPLRCERRGAGLDHDVFAGGGHVFRFPRREVVARKQVAERALLPLVGARIPVPVPVPLLLGRACPAAPHGFTGHARLAGSAAPADLEPSAATVLGRQLGAVLAALHAVDVDELAARAGLRPAALPADVVAASARMAAAAYALLRPDLPAPLRARAEGFLATAPPAPDPRPARLLHGDLAADNVLADARGNLAGLLDWSDLSVGDPAVDFAGLYAWGGGPLLAAALAAYGGASEGLVERARYVGTTLALGALHFAAHGARPVDGGAARRALERALG